MIMKMMLWMLRVMRMMRVYLKTLDHAEKHCEVRYSAYRMALKMRMLQKAVLCELFFLFFY